MQMYYCIDRSKVVYPSTCKNLPFLLSFSVTKRLVHVHVLCLMFASVSVHCHQPLCREGLCNKLFSFSLQEVGSIIGKVSVYYGHLRVGEKKSVPCKLLIGQPHLTLSLESINTYHVISETVLK